MTAIWLDIARLLDRAVAGSFTGIDRVELAYAEHLLTLVPGRIRFVTLNRWSSRFSALPERRVRRFLADVRQAWSDGDISPCRAQALRLMSRSVFSRPPADPAAVYLLVSHRHLHRQAAMGSALRRSGAAFVPLIHDLIPLEFPEYGRPGEAARHRRRIATVRQLANAAVVNSAATGAALAPYLPADRPVLVAPLGVEAMPRPAETPHNARPYFLTVGTIEPRKNHLLLLHLWRRLIERHGDRAPRLMIIGRRGWENENVLDLLDRCEALRGYVTECGAVHDDTMARLMSSARALLMPSFAEGFGLPVAEALACQTPVLCSNLPALREAGGVVPEYLDPLDTPAWEAAIMDYAAEPSVRRTAQQARMPHWQPTRWGPHVSTVLDFALRQSNGRPT